MEDRELLSKEGVPHTNGASTRETDFKINRYMLWHIFRQFPLLIIPKMSKEKTEKQSDGE